MRSIFKVTCLVIAIGLLGATGAMAQPQVLVPPAAFGMIGFIQEATLDGQVRFVNPDGSFGASLAATPVANTDDRAGGTVVVNGIRCYVPNNTYVQMPAFALSWKQLFDPAFSAPVNSPNPIPAANQATGTQTGLALTDAIAAFPSFEISVVGNIRFDLPGHVGQPVYIVGLIAPIAQEQLAGGFGIVNFIYPNDHATHPNRFEVGGTIGVSGTGAIVEINDPVDDNPPNFQGRWGRTHSPDGRFTTDTGNPTVCTAQGYPVGVPNVADPTNSLNTFPFIGPNDPLRPNINRPVNPIVGAAGHDPWTADGAPLKTFTMNVAGPGLNCDPTRELPLRVGDTVDYAGTMYKIIPANPATAANTYISAHTVSVDLGVFTRPGVRPCYVFVEALLVPTALTRNAPPVFAGNPRTSIPLENSTRAVVVGFTTDPSRLVDIKRIEVNPTTGGETMTTYATVLPEALGAGRVRGRFRFTPSRTTGIFPPTRDYIAMSRTGQLAQANGLMSGQYRLPCFDFLFGERLTHGDPTVPNQFDTMPFLASGCGPITGGPVFGRLDPWPGPNPPVTNP